MNLEKLGFDACFQESFRPYQNKGYLPARIAAQHKGRYIVHTENGQMSGKLSGEIHLSVGCQKGLSGGGGLGGREDY